MRVVEERPLVVPLQAAAVDAPNRQVHLRQPPRRQVALLPEDREIGQLPLPRRHELLRLDEHPARPAARIEDAALERLQHQHQKLDDAPGRVELPALLALRQRELAQEILEDVAQHVRAPGLGVAERDVAHEVDQFPEARRVEVLPGEDLREHVAQRRIVLLDRVHRRVHVLADLRRLRPRAQVRPPCRRRDEEHVLRPVLVAILRIGPGVLALARQKPRVNLLERIGDVLQEDQPQRDVLVLGGVDVLAELIGGFPELLFEGFFRGGLDRLGAGHKHPLTGELRVKCTTGTGLFPSPVARSTRLDPLPGFAVGKGVSKSNLPSPSRSGVAGEGVGVERNERSRGEGNLKKHRPRVW